MAHDTHSKRSWSLRRHDDDRVHDEADDGRDATRTEPARSDGAQHAATRDDSYARDRFGGTNWGAAFFGWLVAIAMTVLLSAIVGAAASAVGASLELTESDAQREADTIGLTAAITVVVIMAIAYYTGGYVAGRMSRFDGGRQGLATWLIGLFVTVVAAGAGWIFGSEYNILDRVELPQVAISGDTAAWGGILTAVALLVVTLLAAMAGGKVGRRYHHKVDRAAGR